MGQKKLYDVFTPNPHFTGQRNGVQFKDGKGRATEREATDLVEVWGYSCPELFDVEASADGSGADASDPGKGSRDIEKWQDAVKAVKELESADEVKAFTLDDDRKSVLKAAEERIAELESEEESEEKNSDDDVEPAEDDSEQDNSEEETEEESDSEEEKESE